ncbi:MAG: hypothetical protein ACYS8Z_21765 [Planctomycetota bacterium]|jgi:hypothetical protein
MKELICLLFGFLIGFTVCVVTRPDYEPDEPLVIIEPNDIAIGESAGYYIDDPNEFYRPNNEVWGERTKPEEEIIRSEPNEYFSLVRRGGFFGAIPNYCLFDEHLKKYLPEWDTIDSNDYVDGWLAMSVLLLEQRVKALEARLYIGYMDVNDLGEFTLENPVNRILVIEGKEE